MKITKMWAIFVVVVMVSSIFGLSGYVSASQNQHYRLGAILISPEKYSKLTGFQFIPLTRKAYEHLIEIAPHSDYSGRVSKSALLALAHPHPVGATNLPTSVNNSLYLPPIGNQGDVGSCNAWSSTYYVYTYMLNWFRGYPHPTGNYVMNPTFTYNLINNGSDSGSIPEDAMVLISTVGAVPLGDFPLYNASSTSDMPSDYLYVWPNETQWKEAIINKAIPAMYNSIWESNIFGQYGGKIYVVNLSNTTQFNYLKGLLAAGYVAQTAIIVYSNFFNFDTSNDIYALNSVNIFDEKEGGHAVTIVGYDDNLSTSDGKGAFLMVNSWGTGWGDHGYWWLTYPAAEGKTNSWGQQLSQGLAYIYVPEGKVPRHPNVYAVFHITYSKRGEIIGGTYDSSTGQIEEPAGINLGFGEPSSPLWSRWFFNFYIGYYTSASDLADYQPYAFPASPIALDLSDGLANLTNHVSSQDVPFYIYLADKYQDGVTGTLDFFQIIVNSTYIHRIINATGLPETIPENGSWLTVSVNVPVVEYTGITPLPGAMLHSTWAEVEVGSLVNLSSAILTINGKQYTMHNTSPMLFYYNVTGLTTGTYRYNVTVVFKDGEKITLPTRTFEVNTGSLETYIVPDSSAWASTVTVAPGSTKYLNGTFVWVNDAQGKTSPFTNIHYHITSLEVRYNSKGLLMLKIGVTPLENLGSTPSVLLNISFDTNGNGKWDYHAVIDLSKPGTKADSANLLSLYNSTGGEISNSQSIFIPVPSESAVYVQIPAKLLGISGESSISVRIQLYEHDDVYGPLDVLTTSNGTTTATIDLTQVPTFSDTALVVVILLAGVFLFWRRR